MVVLLALILFVLVSSRVFAECAFTDYKSNTLFFGKMKNPEYWEMIKNNLYYAPYIEKLLREYPSKEQGIPQVYYSARREINFSGDRKGFERPYFTRRDYMLKSAVLAMLFPDKPEYLVNAQDAVWAVCEEYNWVLSAHTPSVLEWEKTVDLGATATVKALAWVCMILEDRLDSETMIMVRQEVRRRIFEPFEKNTFFWNTDVNNWNAVCNGDICFSMVYFEPENAKKYIPKFVKSMDCYLNGFTKEGCCLEGIGYWEYGISHFVRLADTFRRFTEGEVNLFEDERAKRAASFAQKCMLKGGATVSFADAERERKISRNLMEYLRAVYPDTVRSVPKENTAADYFQELVYGPAMPDYSQAESGEYYLEEAEQVVLNYKNYSFACKAGTNYEPHNHNDIGSFIIADKNGQTFCDPGLGLYSKAYFADRYKDFVTPSRGHSVPIINGEYQIAGGVGGMIKKEFAAVLDLTGAYKIDGLKKAERTFEWSEKGIILKDEFEGDLKEIKERFVTVIEPEITEGGIKSGCILMHYPKALTPIITLVNYINNSSQTETVWTVDFVLDSKYAEFRFEVIEN